MFYRVGRKAVFISKEDAAVARFFALILFVYTCISGWQASAQIFVGYDVFCGLPVIVTPTSQGAVAGLSQNGQRAIFIDPSVSQNLTTSSMFAVAHECGHHFRGHTTAVGLGARFLGATRTQELEADCWAAKELAKIGDISDLQRMVNQFASQGDYRSGPYPSGLERARTVARCANFILDASVTNNQQASEGDFCSNLIKATELSGSKFRSIRTSRDSVGGWDTDFRIDGATDCSIQRQSDGEVNMYCKFENSYSDVKDRARECLSGWILTERTRSNGRNSGKFKTSQRRTTVRIFEARAHTALDISDMDN